MNSILYVPKLRELGISKVTAVVCYDNKDICFSINWLELLHLNEAYPAEQLL